MHTPSGFEGFSNAGEVDHLGDRVELRLDLVPLKPKASR
jgi:hypothetical protein